MRLYRISAAARPCLLVLAMAVFASAQEPAPVPQPLDELRALRESIDQQRKQIEVLTQQIAELTRRLTAQTIPAPASPPVISPAQTVAPTQTPPPESAATTPPPAGTPDASGGIKHTVAKGETLTSIAKRYNISLSELEKANKITDDRKLQIGHVLNIPTAPNKAPEPPTDKKENP